ncbi:hypothetical protein AAC387_Pa04g2088 [Persea americana]
MNEAIQDSPMITDDEGTFCGINQEIQNDRIRRIIQYQKSLYYSSSSSCAASCSSSSTYSKSSSLLDLMKGGNASLRRLFDMEHTCLSTHFNDYSGSPVIKPIYLWGSDEDEGALSTWSTTIKRLKPPEGSSELDDLIGFASDDDSTDTDSGFAEKKSRNKQPLSRTKSFRTLPGLRLRRLRVIFCGRKLCHKKSHTQLQRN